MMIAAVTVTVLGPGPVAPPLSLLLASCHGHDAGWPGLRLRRPAARATACGCPWQLLADGPSAAGGPGHHDVRRSSARASLAAGNHTGSLSVGPVAGPGTSSCRRDSPAMGPARSLAPAPAAPGPGRPGDFPTASVTVVTPTLAARPGGLGVRYSEIMSPDPGRRCSAPGVVHCERERETERRGERSCIRE